MKAAKMIKTAVISASISIPLSAFAQDYVGWVDYAGGGDQWLRNKARLQAFGEQFDTAWDMYQFLERRAGGGDDLTWADMVRPEYDWTGVYTRTRGGLSFDPDIGPDQLSAQLTEEGAAARDAKIAMMAATGGEYDPISDCRPPGHPRWASEPFLHDFVVTPDQTYLINEMVNDIRRVYTDGRAHTDPLDAYPTWNGDTIGFWDDGTLVMHTTYLNAGQYQRGTQPDYSDQVEVVERWRKVDGINLEADFWVFDPVNLAEPWYTRQAWIELENDEHLLRIRYWWCGENQNNDIIVTDDGTSQFPDFDFLDNDAEVSSDASVQRFGNQ